MESCWPHPKVYGWLSGSTFVLRAPVFFCPIYFASLLTPLPSGSGTFSLFLHSLSRVLTVSKFQLAFLPFSGFRSLGY